MCSVCVSEVVDRKWRGLDCTSNCDVRLYLALGGTWDINLDGELTRFKYKAKHRVPKHLDLTLDNTYLATIGHQQWPSVCLSMLSYVVWGKGLLLWWAGAMLGCKGGLCRLCSAAINDLAVMTVSIQGEYPSWSQRSRFRFFIYCIRSFYDWQFLLTTSLQHYG